MGRTRTIRTQFGGLSVDEPINRLKSGMAREARNVILEGSQLQGRYGFDEYCKKSVGSSKGILNMEVWQCAQGASNAGEMYILLKATDGKVYYSQIWTGSAAAAITAWTAITTQWTHSSTQRGSFFVAEDRVYYFDSAGGSKWHPTGYNKPSSVFGDTPVFSGSLAAVACAKEAWKAGIICTGGMVFGNAGTGGKEGFYRTANVLKNSKTKAMSTYSTPGPTNAEETRISAAEGALATAAASVWTTFRDTAADKKYEWDTYVGLCTMGSTEKKLTAQSPSHQLFVDVEVARNSTTANGGGVSMSKADAVLQYLSKGRPFPNSGGIPPACLHAVWNGTRALYANTYDTSAVFVPGEIAFSLPGQPAMVPGEQTYTVGVDVTTISPSPWTGFINVAVGGRVRGLGYIGQRFLIFTELDTYWVAPVADGRLTPVRSDARMGCASDAGSCVTAHGCHALGFDTWLQVTPQGARDAARFQFKNLLLEIPTAYVDDSVVAPFPYRSEVWAAVARENYDCAEVKIIDGASEADVDASAAAAGYTYNFQMFPSAPAAGDAVCFGAAAFPTSVTVAVNRPAVYDEAAVITWKYWNGSAWVAATVTSDTTNPDTQDGTLPFIDDGKITLTDPGDSVAKTINSVSKHYVKAEIATPCTAELAELAGCIWHFHLR